MEVVDKNGYTWTQDDKGVWGFKHTPHILKSETKTPEQKKYAEPPPYKVIYTLEETYKDAFNKVLSGSVKEIEKIINDSIK